MQRIEAIYSDKDVTGNKGPFMAGPKANRIYDNMVSPGILGDSNHAPSVDFNMTGIVPVVNGLLNLNNVSRSSIKEMTIRRGPYNGTGGGEVTNTLTLLINPAQMGIQSNQMVDTQLARNGYVVTLWGRSQGVLNMSGVSPAFIRPNSGLAGSEFGGSGRKDLYEINDGIRKSAGYANMLSLLAFFKNNGWHYLSSANDPYPSSVGLGRTLSNTIHVLDNVTISYDGVNYEGSFQTFSIEQNSASPFRFNYNFDFVISGINGDRYEGHLNDGVNKDTGIVLAIQGSNTRFVETSGASYEDALSIETQGLYKSTPLPKVRGDVDLLNSPTGIWWENALPKITTGDANMDYQLSNLREEPRNKIADFIRAAQRAGYVLRISDGFRSPARSAAMRKEWDDGSRRFAARPSPAWSSWHNYGCAVDIMVDKAPPGDEKGKPTSKLGALATGGVTWGGTFSEADPVHFQYTVGFSQAAMKKEYQASDAKPEVGGDPTSDNKE